MGNKMNRIQTTGLTQDVVLKALREVTEAFSTKNFEDKSQSLQYEKYSTQFHSKARYSHLLQRSVLRLTLYLLPHFHFVFVFVLLRRSEPTNCSNEKSCSLLSVVWFLTSLIFMVWSNWALFDSDQYPGKWHICSKTYPFLAYSSFQEALKIRNHLRSNSPRLSDNGL